MPIHAALIAVVVLLSGCSHEPTAPAAPAHAVTVSETPDSYTLANGVLSVRIDKRSGDMTSLRYKDTETLGGLGAGHPYVYWSHDTRNAQRIEYKVTIDPAGNGGERAEISIKAISGGNLMGFGPGTPPEGDLPIDIDIRYSLTRGDSAVYTYTAFDHRPEYGAGDFAEARIAARLAPIFTNIHVDEWRTGRFPLFEEGIDKYVYISRQWANRAYGWTSPSKGLGWFMLIPSPEYLSGGPTKAEFLAHGTTPTVLSYWKSSHNGGANVTLAQGESWQRVVGPIAIYVNEGANSEAMWNDAKARLAREEAAWPYDWVRAAGYANERGEVSGQLALDDPLSPHGNAFHGDLYVGLTRTPYEISDGDAHRTITWQNEAKGYQFWTRVTDRSGRFTIPDVPAGDYTLHAFADGVLGEFARTDVVVSANNTTQLGTHSWTPQRHGRQLWDIGIPDRHSLEFAGADQFFVPAQPLRYTALFPNDIDYTIGKSNPRTDWYFTHMPHGEDPNAEIIPFRGVAGSGRDASRVIRFTLDVRPSGTAVLRIAINGTGSRPVLDYAVNGKPQSRIEFGRDDGSMKRHQVNGIWKLVDTPFDASLLKEGENTLTITVPAGLVNDGVIYDYVRLELAEGKPASLRSGAS